MNGTFANEFVGIDSAQDLCACGKESTVGIHGIKDGKVVDKYVCDDHKIKNPKKEKAE